MNNRHNGDFVDVYLLIFGCSPYNHFIHTSSTTCLFVNYACLMTRYFPQKLVIKPVFGNCHTAMGAQTVTTTVEGTLFTGSFQISSSNTSKF